MKPKTLPLGYGEEVTVEVDHLGQVYLRVGNPGRNDRVTQLSPTSALKIARWLKRAAEDGLS